MTPTAQQLNCIAQAEAHATVQIEACAGAAKTTTLTLIAEKLLVRSLYWTFNKSNAMEAKEKFPTHVTCSTTHSTAYAAFGRQLQHKFTRPKGGYVNVAGTGGEIARFYKLSGYDGLITASGMGVLVKRTVERFEQSADMVMTDKNIPKADIEPLVATCPGIVRNVLTAAKKLWADRTNISSVVLATPDTYLKQFQMSKPTLPYDVLYVDEFQDTTMCVLDIVMNQLGKMKVIVVGDSRQNIYSWRGSVNALSRVDFVKCVLGKSFRYGQAVADTAMHILKGTLEIEGNECIASKSGIGIVDASKPHARLYRTNAALLTDAISAISRGVEVNIEIDTKDFVKQLQSAQALHQGRMKDVKHERITAFPDWASLVEEGKENGELGRIAAAVSSGHSEYMIEVLETYKPSDNPLIIFTTAHKSKGREFDYVILADDFPSHYDRKGKWVGLHPSEENLLYVAATRAKLGLEINASIEEAIEYMISNKTRVNNFTSVIRDLEEEEFGSSLADDETSYWATRKEYERIHGKLLNG